ncbi:hypothetical protein TRVL_09299 [Trypanosoma vivax]|nr:hypothetical protein TRVL_09299 [Trypanosoma vivax]
MGAQWIKDGEVEDALLCGCRGLAKGEVHRFANEHGSGTFNSKNLLMEAFANSSTDAIGNEIVLEECLQCLYSRNVWSAGYGKDALQFERPRNDKHWAPENLRSRKGE